MLTLNPFVITPAETGYGYTVEFEAADENSQVQFKGSMLAEIATTEAEAEQAALAYIRKLIQDGNHAVISDGISGPDGVNPPDILQRSLEKYKAEACKQINEKRDVLEQSGFFYLGRTFDSDKVSIQRISVAVQAAQAVGPEFIVDWTCADNSVITLSYADILGLPVALAQFSNGLHVVARTRKAQIAESETMGAVDAILALPWEV